VSVLELPGPLDPHVHLRDQEWAHKGTVESETAAALAGGYWAVIDMPNTPPPPTDEAALAARLELLASRTRCDVAANLGAGPGSWPHGFGTAPARVAGLKLYLDATTGDLLLEEPSERQRLMAAWRAASARPIALHAEGASLEAALAIAARLDARAHVCHVSRRDEVEMVRRARAAGCRVSAGVTPHHLYLTEQDVPRLGPLARVKPELGTAADRDALWAALVDGTIEVVESDHAPHALAEKRSPAPPHGVPGLETTLPLLALAVHEGRITPERLVEVVTSAPQRLFGLTPPPDTVTRLDLDASWIVEDAALHGSAGWSPFAGMRVRGRVREVRVRGRTTYDGEQVLAAPGAGRVLVPNATNDVLGRPAGEGAHGWSA
jgi:dihydroorotase